MRENRRAGFTVLELLVVLLLASVTMGGVGLAFSRYSARASARQAAEIFRQDLRLARSWAAGSKRPVTVRFSEAGLRYVIRIQGGDTLLVRSFGPGAEIRLTSLDLRLGGDSLAFDSRGVAHLSGAPSGTGEALFSAANSTYAVRFNSLGLARVEKR